MPSGCHVYSGRAFPQWRGNLLVGTVQPRRGLGFIRLVWDGTSFALHEHVLAGQLGRVRFVTENEQGWIYVGNDSGQVIRIRPG